MSDQKKMEMIAEILDLEIGEIKEEANLSDYDEWDSVAVLSFIALMDEEFGKAMRGAEIRKLKTVRDMMAVMEK